MSVTFLTDSTLCQRQTTLEFKVLFPWKPDKSGMSTVSRRCCLGHSPAVCLACLHVPVLPSVPASVSWVRITSGSSLSGFPKALFGSTVNERHSLPHPSVQESMENRVLLWFGSPDPDCITGTVMRTSQGSSAKDVTN
uniref:Uncharacterized protein LOC112812016 n=1 Tax=Callorhinus ursinus TaxID=34884 RepID=A0A3Q7MYN9_CALUR|nr:uncharacterized protein LOC112812016 [Callorhinus ursinus]